MIASEFDRLRPCFTRYLCDRIENNSKILDSFYLKSDSQQNLNNYHKLSSTILSLRRSGIRRANPSRYDAEHFHYVFRRISRERKGRRNVGRLTQYRAEISRDSVRPFPFACLPQASSSSSTLRFATASSFLRVVASFPPTGELCCCGDQLARYYITFVHNEAWLPSSFWLAGLRECLVSTFPARL